MTEETAKELVAAINRLADEVAASRVQGWSGQLGGASPAKEVVVRLVNGLAPGAGGHGGGGNWI